MLYLCHTRLLNDYHVKGINQNSDFSMFKFFRGEKKNPFDHDRQNAASNYWNYESIFEEKFNAGDFSAAAWIPPNPADLKEWDKVLASNPIDKAELFKLWLFYLLMDRLPDKYQPLNKDEFLCMYYGSEIKIPDPTETA